MPTPETQSPAGGRGDIARAPGEVPGHSMSAGAQASSLLLRWKSAMTAAADPRLSRVDLAAHLLILNYINNATGAAWPSAETVARGIGANVRSVIRARRKLVALGHLIETTMIGKPNRYRIGTPDTSVTPDMHVTPDTESTPPLTPVSLTPDIPVTGPLTPVSAELVLMNQSKNQSKEPTKKRTQKARAGGQDQIHDLIALDLPEGLTRENWTAYVEHRAGMPKAKRLTATSAAMCLRKLKTWAAQGHDPNDIVCASIANGWQGLFEPKGPPATKPPGRVSVPSEQQAADINAKADARLAKLRPSVADSFAGKVYTGATDEELDAFFGDRSAP